MSLGGQRSHGPRLLIQISDFTAKTSHLVETSRAQSSQSNRSRTAERCMRQPQARSRASSERLHPTTDNNSTTNGCAIAEVPVARALQRQRLHGLPRLYRKSRTETGGEEHDGCRGEELDSHADVSRSDEGQPRTCAGTPRPTLLPGRGTNPQLRTNRPPQPVG